ncbi:hypothetical protein CDL12_07744 [Handroanthus impetiginosus]|uniref:Pollen allergen Ole e 1 family n=1 Tax=Handroanthus impetiginosus TaxID=429701 RepID=A0A2G9HPX8_9LAMI|nr:hypothetical protein CDL12_07744 [Handroanthus impetiginosus]
MAKLSQLVILFAGALSLLSLCATASGPKFIVEGQVFCEVCRANFINRLSEPMPGAKVRLECRGEDKGNITLSLEGVTNDKGVYQLPVEGDHGTESCEVLLVKSSKPDCDVIPSEGWAGKPSSRVTITTNNGFHGQTRQANPLGFTRKVALPQCKELFKELELTQDS